MSIAHANAFGTGANGCVELLGSNWDAAHVINVLDLTGQASDPGSPANGNMWYNSTIPAFKYRLGGVTYIIGDFASLTGKPTTLSGYGITDAALDGQSYGVLTADYTLTATISTQKLFNFSTNGALTLASGIYTFEAKIYVTSMDPTAGNAKFDLLGAGTATIVNCLMHAIGSDVSTATTIGTQSGVMAITTTFGTNIVAAATNTGLVATITGTFDMTVGGTVIPSIALTTAAAAVVGKYSSFRCLRIGNTGSNTKGTWT